MQPKIHLFLTSLFAVTILLFISIFFFSLLGPTTMIGQVINSMPSPQQAQRDLPQQTIYVYGARLIASTSEGGLQYHMQDLISTNRVTVSDIGLLNSRFSNYPFGKKIDGSSYSSTQQKFTYTGKEDDGTIMYYGARYYSPRLGRFISIDPIITPSSPYHYVGNHPLTATDPTGKEEAPPEDMVFTWIPQENSDTNSPQGYFAPDPLGTPGGTGRIHSGSAYDTPDWQVHPTPSVLLNTINQNRNTNYNLWKYFEDEGEWRLANEDFATEPAWINTADIYNPDNNMQYDQDNPGEPWVQAGIYHFSFPFSTIRISPSTGPAADVASAPLVRGFQVVGPNPSANHVTIRYSTNADITLKMNLIDIQGRVVQEVANGPVKAGEYTRQVDVSLLASGKYWFHSNEFPARNIVVVR